MAKVIVVEDETPTRRAIAAALREAGFEVSEASDAMACKALMKTMEPDAIVLDLGLPGLSGIDFVEELRVQSDVGLLIVTRRDTQEARIKCLDLGADDYLIKPVHYGELAARIRSVLRRRQVTRGRRKQLGPWIVDMDARAVTAGVESASLTRGEFDILAALIDAHGKIVSREELLRFVSRRPLDADVRSVDALVSRLRRKLGEHLTAPGMILTAQGFGYRLSLVAADL